LSSCTPVSASDVHIDVSLIDFDIEVECVVPYTGKVTSAESLGRIFQQAQLLSGLSQ
jgi:hypothetical protein